MPRRRRVKSREPKGCLGALFGLGPVRKRARVEDSALTLPAEELPYQKKKYLLSKAESELFRALQSAVGETYLIFAMVRLADLIYVQRGTESRQTHFNRIQSKHIDFVLCDRDPVRPVLAIELDDSSHNRADRRERDAFVDAALEAARFPLLRIEAQGSYDSGAIAAAIQSARMAGLQSEV